MWTSQITNTNDWKNRFIVIWNVILQDLNKPDNEPLIYSDWNFILIAIHIPSIALQSIISVSGFLFDVGFELTLGFAKEAKKSIKHFIQEQLWKWQLKDYKTITFLQQGKHNEGNWTITNNAREKELYTDNNLSNERIFCKLLFCVTAIYKVIVRNTLVFNFDKASICLDLLFHSMRHQLQFHLG